MAKSGKTAKAKRNQAEALRREKTADHYGRGRDLRGGPQATTLRPKRDLPSR